MRRAKGNGERLGEGEGEGGIVWALFSDAVLLLIYYCVLRMSSSGAWGAEKWGGGILYFALFLSCCFDFWRV